MEKTVKDPLAIVPNISHCIEEESMLSKRIRRWLTALVAFAFC
jgi:hypothetical protein